MVKEGIVQGVEYIQYKISRDERGVSSKINIDLDNVSDFINNTELFVSESHIDVIRGMHVQTFPCGQKKVVVSTKGLIKGCILDVRNDSDTFLQYMEVDLEDNGIGIVIPPYCGWGYRTLKESTLVYTIFGRYEREHDKGFNINSFEWGERQPIDELIMSNRDKGLPSLDRFIKEIYGGKIL